MRTRLLERAGFSMLDLERVFARGAAFVPRPVGSNELVQAASQAVASQEAVSAS